MKKILCLILVYFLISCSPEENSNSTNTPETYNVKYEIKGYGEVPQIMYMTNEGLVTLETELVLVNDEYVLKGIDLPFVVEIQYKTEEDGVTNPDGTKSYGCDQLYISAYAKSSDGRIEEMNIYIDGTLQDTEDEGYYYQPGQHWTPWGSAIFNYLRRGADNSLYNCN